MGRTRSLYAFLGRVEYTIRCDSDFQFSFVYLWVLFLVSKEKQSNYKRAVNRSFFVLEVIV